MWICLVDMSCVALTCSLCLARARLPLLLGLFVSRFFLSTSTLARRTRYFLTCSRPVLGYWTALSNAYTGAGVTILVHLAPPAATGANVKLSGLVGKAIGCRMLSTIEDTLFTTAKDFGSDWLSVWSMNAGNPDKRRTLTARYYAHPLEVTWGETAEAIMRRFAISTRELARSNPGVMDLESLTVGDTLCVIPNFLQTISGNGAKICL
jgi:hypothetical protein